MRSLIVEPTGHRVEKNYPTLAILSNNTSDSYQREIQFEWPEDVTEGSERVEVSACGDTMGPALSGFDNLLQMPTGCGEQNMINFAPADYIEKYLEETGQLTPEDRSMAKKVKEKGYDREWMYQHQVFDVGAFSAFGDSGMCTCRPVEGRSRGVCWLTLFVLRIMNRVYGTIPKTKREDCKLAKAAKWVLSQQKSGVFEEHGNVIHRDFGASKGPTKLTAYALVALTESPWMFRCTGEDAEEYGDLLSKRDEVERQARIYLESKLDSGELDTDPGTLALLSYGLALAKSAKAQSAIEKLDNLAKTEGGERFWPEKDGPKVDTAALAMLAYLTHSKPPTGETLVKCNGVARWMSGKRSARGGFSTTTGTVWGIHALSSYASMTSSYARQLEVAFISNGDGQRTAFQVTRENQRLYQSTVIEGATSKNMNSMTVDVRGVGMVLAQVTYWYNTEREKIGTDCILRYSYEENRSDYFKMRICWDCQKKADGAGMGLVNINPLSGYEPEGGVECTGKCNLQKVEKKQGAIAAYFDSLKYTVDGRSVEQCIRFKYHAVEKVLHVKPAMFTVQDYYVPENADEYQYVPSEAEGKTACQLCGAQCGCPPDPIGGDGAAGVSPPRALMILPILLMILGFLKSFV